MNHSTVAFASRFFPSSYPVFSLLFSRLFAGSNITGYGLKRPESGAPLHPKCIGSRIFDNFSGYFRDFRRISPETGSLRTASRTTHFKSLVRFGYIFPFGEVVPAIPGA